MATPALDDTRPEVAADPAVLPKQMLIGGQRCDAANGKLIAEPGPAGADPDQCRAPAPPMWTAPWLRRRRLPGLVADGPARPRPHPAAHRRRAGGAAGGAGALDRPGNRQRLAHPGARPSSRPTPSATSAAWPADCGGTSLPLGKDMLSYTRRRADRFVGAIVPWNAPAQLASLKIAPAICAGNTIVLKAAEDAPLAVLLIAGVCQDFLPPASSTC